MATIAEHYGTRIVNGLAEWAQDTGGTVLGFVFRPDGQGVCLKFQPWGGSQFGEFVTHRVWHNDETIIFESGNYFLLHNDTPGHFNEQYHAALKDFAERSDL